MKACFIGLGYIGLPTAIIAAKHGVQVTGVDINPQVVEMTNQGRLHIVEPGLEEMLRENQALFAGGTISEEAKDAYFQAVMKAYLECKEAAKETYGRKKKTAPDKQ